MIKLYAYHEEKGNKNNFQERNFEYSSWDNFIRDVKEIDGTIKELSHPLIPRQTKIENVVISHNRIDYELTMRINRMRVSAYVEVVE